MTSVVRIEEPADLRVPAAARPWALWALGFRPMYLLASTYAALALPLWVLQFAGIVPGLRASAWHAHEMLFGFALAVVVGFLLTAGRNWSGQPTPSGAPLMALAGLWVAGRVLVYTPWAVATLVVDLAFVLFAAFALWRALRAGGNTRNDFFVAVLAGIAVAQGLMQASLLGWISRPHGWALQLGLDAVLFVMTVMGGRVIPMFSNSGAPGTDAVRDPRVERVALGSVLALWGADAFGLDGVAMAALALLAALAHALRWWRWHPWRTRGVPLVWVLHLAYAWIPVYLAMRSAAALGLIAPSLATHALTAGAIGGMTIGMMTRTARGHLGLPLRAEGAEVWMYALVAMGALVRVGVPLAAPTLTVEAAVLAGLLWSAGFALYALRYGPWLCRARFDGKPG
jgi:uncharacterized protein involved in response to NO